MRQRDVRLRSQLHEFAMTCLTVGTLALALIGGALFWWPLLLVIWNYWFGG